MAALRKDLTTTPDTIPAPGTATIFIRNIAASADYALVSIAGLHDGADGEVPIPPGEKEYFEGATLGTITVVSEGTCTIEWGVVRGAS